MNDISGSISGSVLAVCIAALSVLGMPQGASAHHSTAAYDSTRTVTLAGVVSEVHWVNPHAYVDVVVSDTGGKKTKWAVLSGTPTLNVRNGWKYTDVKKGDKVTVVGYPSRSGDASAIMAHITLADGRTIQGPREFLAAPKP